MAEQNYEVAPYQGESWSEHWDEEGNQYWYNDSTGESSYENPDVYAADQGEQYEEDQYAVDQYVEHHYTEEYHDGQVGALDETQYEGQGTYEGQEAYEGQETYDGKEAYEEQGYDQNGDGALASVEEGATVASTSAVDSRPQTPGKHVPAKDVLPYGWEARYGCQFQCPAHTHTRVHLDDRAWSSSGLFFF